ncbi:hypothetical protein D3C83_45910 [compost metagenome]
MEIDPHASAVLGDLVMEHPEIFVVLRVRRSKAVPGLYRVAGVHRAARVKTVCAQFRGEVYRDADFVHVEARR